jgi:hypothetical protein
MTAREKLIHAYANVAMAHTAITQGAEVYVKLHYAIRTRYRRNLGSGKWKFGSITKDERQKLTLLPQACSYCGSRDRLSIDHLVPKARGGADRSENMVLACRSCNSSKGSRDLMEWYVIRAEFPPLLLLRRYLKLAYLHFEAQGMLDMPLEECGNSPFALQALPDRFPPPAELRLWVPARDALGAVPEPS